MRLAWVGAGALVVSSVLVGGGCSTAPSSIPEKASVRSTAQAIQGGSTDTADTFAVGVCGGFGAVNSGQCATICSGALILPNVVATARHCVDDSPEQIDCSANPSFGSRKQLSYRITTNTTMDGAVSGWYGVQSILTPSDAHICGNDMALLILSSSVPSNVARTITPGVQYQMWDSDHYGASFLGIGYGKTSPANVNDAGTRRISKPISVLCVPGSDNLPCPAQLTSVNAAEFYGGDGTCSGDSGSSAYDYASYANDTPVSFGVLSRGGESTDGASCLGSIYTRFDAHRDFVISVAKSASNNWTLYPEPSWTAYAPPPTPKGKDAGTKDGSATSSGGLGIGESCTRLKDCASNVCTDPGDGNLICSQNCDPSDATTCPDGYQCSADSVCLPAAAAAPTTPAAAGTTTTTTGCAAAPTGTSGSGWALAGVGLALALAVSRRRAA